MTNEADTLTLEEAAELPGVSLNGTGLQLHFSPLCNWYWCITGFKCPRCHNPISWEWDGKLPNITSPMSIQESGIHPKVEGAALQSWGHRYIELTCDNCNTELFAENFD